MSTLDVLPGRYAVCRLNPAADLPAWATRGQVTSITRTPAELSIVCDEAAVPVSMTAERGWRMLALQGPIDFALTGVLSSLLTPLAAAKISIFALSTYDTDYVLVREPDLRRAVDALRAAGQMIVDAGNG